MNVSDLFPIVLVITFIIVISGMVMVGSELRDTTELAATCADEYAGKMIHGSCIYIENGSSVSIDIEMALSSKQKTTSEVENE